MDKVKRLKELTKYLNTCRDAYYNDSLSKISDYEYDCLYDELCNLENEIGISLANSPTQTVGYEVKSELKKVKHSHSMLSLDKTKDVNELIKFTGDKDCILSCKMDGLTVLLTYENGQLIQAETRGNGEIGEIITHNAKVFENIPLKINYKGHYEIEGEAIITYDDFEKINSKLPKDKQYKNPRNLVSGSVRQLDSKIASQRHIKFIAWKDPLEEINFWGGFNQAKDFGFDVVPYFTYASTDKENINEMIDKLKETASKFGYPIDGLVMTYADVQYGKSLGITGHHPKHSIAFKFYDDVYETTLTSIDWTIGKTGQLTPTAVFQTVEIDGTDVSRASVHNISILTQLDLHIGDRIEVYKANQIIPQLSTNLSAEERLKTGKDAGYIEIPAKCPICNAPTEIKQDNDSKVLICTNPNCKGKLLGKLTHFCSKNAMDIRGLSESTLEKLIELGMVDCYEDIYDLKDNYYEQLMHVDGFGKKSVDKLMESIESSKNTTLSKFLYSLSIPLIGKSASKDIAKACSNNIQSFIDILSLEGEYAFVNIDGFGKEMSKSLQSWWVGNKQIFYTLFNILNFKQEESSSNSQKLFGKTFVITGLLEHYKNRNELVSVIESLGGKVTGSVSAKTDYLVNNDKQSSSSKNQKAKKLNVTILSENDFLSLIS